MKQKLKAIEDCVVDAGPLGQDQPEQKDPIPDMLFEGGETQGGIELTTQQTERGQTQIPTTQSEAIAAQIQPAAKKPEANGDIFDPFSK